MTKRQLPSASEPALSPPPLPKFPPPLKLLAGSTSVIARAHAEADDLHGDTHFADHSPEASLQSHTATVEQQSPGMGLIQLTEDRVDLGQEESSTQPSRKRSWARRWLGWSAGTIWRGVSWVWGLASLVLLLGLLASVPVLQLLVLGYFFVLMERVGKTGKVIAALKEIKPAGRLGLAVLLAWLMTLPGQILTSLGDDGTLITQATARAARLNMIGSILTIVLGVHVFLALIRGGAFSYFFRPIKNLKWFFGSIYRRELLEQIHLGVKPWVEHLSLKRTASMAVRGFLATAVWLAIPSTLLAIGRSNPLVGILGSIFVAYVVGYLVLLQAHFAVEDRWKALFDRRFIKELFRRAPLCYFLSTALLLTLSVPLYLMKIELIPRDIVWLTAVFFVLTMLPCKLLIGWTYYQACKRTKRSSFLLVWPTRLLMLALTLAYTGIVFLAHYTLWSGAAGLYEHHAFLVPSPF